MIMNSWKILLISIWQRNVQNLKTVISTTSVVDIVIEHYFSTPDIQANDEAHHRPLSPTVSQSRITSAITDHHQPTGHPCEDKPWGPQTYYFWNHPLQLMVMMHTTV